MESCCCDERTIVTGAVLDGWGQEEGKKAASEKGDILLAPTRAAVLGKKTIQPIHEMLKKHRGRQGFYPLNHTIYFMILLFIYF